MECSIVKRPAIILVGMSFYGNPFSQASAWDEDNEIGSLWKRFYSYIAEFPNAIKERSDGGRYWYEVHIDARETAKTGRYEVFVGVETKSVREPPLQCSVKILPGSDYAKITVRGEEIGRECEDEFQSVLVVPAGRRISRAFSFEQYDERFKGMDRLMESALDYYLPLEGGESA